MSSVVPARGSTVYGGVNVMLSHGDQSEVGSQWLDGLVGRGTAVNVPLGYVNVTVGKLSIP